MAREIQISRANCREYFKKGREFSDYAKLAAEGGAYDVASSNAIHAAILFLDSVNIADLGLKSGSENHRDTIVLFKRANVQSPNLRNEKEGMIRSFLSIIEKKSAAEYIGDGMSTADAERILHNMEKIKAFVEKELSSRNFL